MHLDFSELTIIITLISNMVYMALTYAVISYCRSSRKKEGLPTIQNDKYFSYFYLFLFLTQISFLIGVIWRKVIIGLFT